MTSFFCDQCEQTLHGTGCNGQAGVCGKSAPTAIAQDKLFARTQSLAKHIDRCMKEKACSLEFALNFLNENLFMTVTNVHFDEAKLLSRIEQTDYLIFILTDEYVRYCTRKNKDETPITGAPVIGVLESRMRFGEDINSLRETLTYGLKGMAAYAVHARELGERDIQAEMFTVEALCALHDNVNDGAVLLDLVMRCGSANYQIMEALDRGHTRTFGHPEPTPVSCAPRKGKAILISGHDMLDLFALLKQTQDSGIMVYTHGEMLPAHAYPVLRAFPHFAGHYGTAWQNQHAEFEAFPGAILMTTNCIQKPRETYINRIFTCGLVQYPGVTHLEHENFQPLIDAALAAPGYTQDGTGKTLLVGFGHEAIKKAAPAIVDAVKSGKIKGFYLIGGCDGAKVGRNYYTELAQAVPKDCVILTLACGKYRFNMLEFGEIAGIPRLIDIGQCNDAYSAVQAVLMLSEAFKCGPNDLPLHIILSWYEQKAVAVLLTLLSLNIRNIKIGPSLPAFISPAVLKTLVEKFALAPISTPEKDLASSVTAQCRS